MKIECTKNVLLFEDERDTISISQFIFQDRSSYVQIFATNDDNENIYVDIPVEDFKKAIARFMKGLK